MNRQACIDSLARRLELEGQHPRTALKTAAVTVAHLEREGWLSFAPDDVSATNYLPGT